MLARTKYLHAGGGGTEPWDRTAGSAGCGLTAYATEKRISACKCCFHLRKICWCYPERRSPATHGVTTKSRILKKHTSHWICKRQNKARYFITYPTVVLGCNARPGYLGCMPRTPRTIHFRSPSPSPWIDFLMRSSMVVSHWSNRDIESNSLTY